MIDFLFNNFFFFPDTQVQKILTEFQIVLHHAGENFRDNFLFNLKHARTTRFEKGMGVGGIAGSGSLNTDSEFRSLKRQPIFAAHFYHLCVELLKFSTV